MLQVSAKQFYEVIDLAMRSGRVEQRGDGMCFLDGFELGAICAGASFTLSDLGQKFLTADAVPQTISLRDQFAMAAMNAMIIRSGGAMERIIQGSISEYSYQVADAMLKAREEV